MLDTLTRDNVDRFVVREIGRPRGRDARIRLIEIDGGRAILKDMAGSHRLFRALIGRGLIRREFRTLRRLDDLDGVPRAYRMLDRDAFLMEFVDGAPLSRRDAKTGRLQLTSEPFDRCLELVAAMHDRGVYHLDLRTCNNVVFDAELRPHLIDFASAVSIPRWLIRSVVGRVLGAFDRAGILKTKRRLAPASVRADEERFLERFELWRTILWPPAAIGRWLRRRRRKRRAER
jgi:RIO-like serine/threonine protein kinase